MTFRLAPMLDSHVVVDDLDSEWPYSATKRDGSIVHGTSIGFFEVEATCTIHGPQGEALSRCSARCNNREAKYRALSFFEIRKAILKMAEKRAFVSAVLMATGASDIFTQDLEDVPELAETVMPNPPPKPKASGALTPKREAWFFRAGREAGLSELELAQIHERLASAGSEEVKRFFDGLATGRQVFETYRAA